ncbi:ATP-binding protein [Candidatus Parcubacteria bacterium]|nr:ATP-binding protein [Candidatus Parcubacteria bacterium]
MLIKRTLHQEITKYINSTEAIVVTGMRRVGKTTLLQMLFDELQTDNKLFLDLENPLNQKYFSVENYDAIIDSFSELGINSNKQSYIFLDEIQSLPQIPSIIKYLIDHYQIKFFLSGSASFYIKNLFSESLSGRKYIFELSPFSFEEFLLAKKINPPVKKDVISESTHLFYTRYLNEYIRYGGFPGVVMESSFQEKIKKLEDIFSSYWSLEVERLSDFRKKDKVRDFIFLLMQRTGSRLDITKLSKELGVAKDTVNAYLSFLKDTYLISTINPFSTNRDTEIRSAKKIYFIDTGILNHFAKLSEGSIFENACFNLLSQKGSVQYYQRKNGVEIDFIFNEKTAYEIKLSAQRQYINSLVRTAKSINISDYKIISKNYFNDPKVSFAFLL